MSTIWDPTARARRAPRESELAARVQTLVRGSTSRSESLARALRLSNPAWLCVLSAAGLTLLGIFSIDAAQRLTPGLDTQLSAVALKQVVFAIVGTLAAMVVALPHFRLLGWLSWPALLACIALLVLLLAPGVPAAIVTPRNGARAWIDLGPIDLQPSELAKIAFVLVVAQYLKYRTSHRELRGLLIPGLIAAIPVGLITLQPDLGTAALFVPSLFAMLIAAGARLRHLTLIVACAALAAPAVYPVLKPHQKQRIVGLVKQFQGDTASARDINFQAYTAQNLIGAGGLDGHPPARARALVHHNRLPERHNDTVFAVLVARFGLLGGLAVIALYGLWLLGALACAAICREPQGRLLAVGLAAFIAAQAAVNIGMNLGLLPIIGVTLPFVSYGGSSLVTSWLMTGLVLNVGLHRARPPYRRSFEFGDD